MSRSLFFLFILLHTSTALTEEKFWNWHAGLWSQSGKDPAVGGPGGRLPLALGSADPWENYATALAYNIEFIIIIWRIS